MIKIDLHTHSSQSPDGGLTESDYKELLTNKTLDYIAITDHDDISLAKKLNKELGEQIIVGEEITTNQGEIIGLFLTDRVLPNQDINKTIADITSQGGLIYIPHPFETVRKGISREIIDKIRPKVDIIEAHNGRAIFQNRGPAATTWARLNNIAIASSSDAHGRKGIGSSYTQINEVPTADNLVQQLKKGRIETGRPPMLSLLYPKYNRIRGKLGLS